ncbi:MAG: glutaminyl-peptide cyclotransferase [Deltaproteobacteria bacterium]|nr:glutaminyl-peptide cyclotransferase [Deltaproteobacteria bacterium]
MAAKKKSAKGKTGKKSPAQRKTASKKAAPKASKKATKSTGVATGGRGAYGERENDGAFGRWGSSIPESLVLRVVRTHPHDPEAFTQGLLMHDGDLFESTGLRGESTLRRVDLETGESRGSVDVPDEFFAEGLARVGDHLVQLTWQAGTALVWDLETLEKVGEHEYRGEGWGLCYDGERLIMTSGNDRLQFRDPDTFEKLGEVRVTRAGRRLRQLNELECVDGLVYANVWTDDHIARIDPDTGEVTAWIDASHLLAEEDRNGGEDVLNGIAYMPDTGHFLLTGKRWSQVYEVEFAPRTE